jgi:hypothetical protein
MNPINLLIEENYAQTPDAILCKKHGPRCPDLLTT